MIFAVPTALTALTGLTDWLQMPVGTQARKLATWHLLVMVSATVLFALAWILQRTGYIHGTVNTSVPKGTGLRKGSSVVDDSRSPKHRAHASGPVPAISS